MLSVKYTVLYHYTIIPLYHLVFSFFEVRQKQITNCKQIIYLIYYIYYYIIIYIIYKIGIILYFWDKYIIFEMI